jgi:Uma2 family endonuclease
MRSPDAAWVSKARLNTLTAEQKKKFLPLAPDFAAELRSETDSLTLLQEKMEEYIACGVRLALLLDPTTRKAHLYRPSTEPQVLENPPTLDCSPELPGLTLDIAAIFDADL